MNGPMLPPSNHAASGVSGSSSAAAACRNRTVLGADCRVTGELHLDNDAVILGRFEGLLEVGGELSMPASAVVRGRVRARTLRLGGTLEGEASVSEQVELLDGSRLTGKLIAGRLVVGPGAVLVAEVSIGADRAGRPEGSVTANAPAVEPSSPAAAEDVVLPPPPQLDTSSPDPIVPEIATLAPSVDLMLRRRAPKPLVIGSA